MKKKRGQDLKKKSLVVSIIVLAVFLFLFLIAFGAKKGVLAQVPPATSICVLFFEDCGSSTTPPPPPIEPPTPTTAIVKTADKNVVDEGGEVTYTITFKDESRKVGDFEIRAGHFNGSSGKYSYSVPFKDNPTTIIISRSVYAKDHELGGAYHLNRNDFTYNCHGDCVGGRHYYIAISGSVPGIIETGTTPWADVNPVPIAFSSFTEAPDVVLAGKSWLKTSRSGEEDATTKITKDGFTFEATCCKDIYGAPDKNYIYWAAINTQKLSEHPELSKYIEAGKKDRSKPDAPVETIPGLYSVAYSIQNALAAVVTRAYSYHHDDKTMGTVVIIPCNIFKFDDRQHNTSIVNRNAPQPPWFYWAVAKNLVAPFNGVDGKITRSDNRSNLAGVTLTLEGNGAKKTTKTKSDGSYSFRDLTDGNYTITPSLSGSDLKFSPPTATFEVKNGDSNRRRIDFQGLYTAGSGRITTSTGFGLLGITVNITGNGVNRTITTNQNGEYSFGELTGGNYTITPSYPGLKFIPTNYVFDLTEGQTSAGYNFMASLQ